MSILFYLAIFIELSYLFLIRHLLSESPRCYLNNLSEMFFEIDLTLITLKWVSLALIALKSHHSFNQTLSLQRGRDQPYPLYWWGRFITNTLIIYTLFIQHIIVVNFSITHSGGLLPRWGRWRRHIEQIFIYFMVWDKILDNKILSFVWKSWNNTRIHF